MADVTCDEKPDTVVLGSEKNDVIIGIVSGTPPNKTQVFSFPVRGGTQNGFCAFPTRIEISPLDCEAEGGALPGCKPIKACRAFTVIDNADLAKSYTIAAKRIDAALRGMSRPVLNLRTE